MGKKVRIKISISSFFALFQILSLSLTICPFSVLASIKDVDNETIKNDQFGHIIYTQKAVDTEDGNPFQFGHPYDELFFDKSFQNNMETLYCILNTVNKRSTTLSPELLGARSNPEFSTQFRHCLPAPINTLKKKGEMEINVLHSNDYCTIYRFLTFFFFISSMLLLMGFLLNKLDKLNNNSGNSGTTNIVIQDLEQGRSQLQDNAGGGIRMASITIAKKRGLKERLFAIFSLSTYSQKKGNSNGMRWT